MHPFIFASSRCVGPIVAVIAMLAMPCEARGDAANAIAHAAYGDAVHAVTPSTTRFTSSAFSLAPGAMLQDAASDDMSTPPPTEAVEVRRKFGDAGMVTFNVFGDFATDFDDAYLGGVQLGISWFFIDGLSLDVQLEQYGISQDGPNAYAIGPALLFRWHFLSYETWSLYADAGCGFIYATENVPSNGSRFNFTPRIGVGASIGLTDSARILTGVRWLHISNANTSTPNPGFDSVEIYAGLSFAF